MAAPCAAVPLPVGRPVPSPRMLRSQAAISASVIGFPRRGLSAKLTFAANATDRTAIAILRIDMFELPVAGNAPTGDAIVVLAWKAADARHRLGLAACRN